MSWFVDLGPFSAPIRLAGKQKPLVKLSFFRFRMSMYMYSQVSGQIGEVFVSS